MNERNTIHKITGDDGWELDDEDEAALDAAWESIRLSEFSESMTQQENEDAPLSEID